MDKSSDNDKNANYYETLFLYKNAIESDITFNVKDEVIKAHKVVLGSSNPVFLQTFISQPTLKQIEITFLDPKAFRIYIHYLYTGKVPDENVTEELLLVAHNYLDINLMNVCREKLRKTLTAKNVIPRLDAFIKCHEDNEIVEELYSFVARNYNDLKLCCEFLVDMLFSPNAELIISYFDDCKVTILTEYLYPTINKLYYCANNSDLTIKVQDYLFLAHKEILSTRNTVFETVILALPTTSNVASTIDIPDFDPVTFENFLKFIYTGEVNEYVITKQLMKVAHEYVEDKLLKMCEDFFVPEICETNAIEMLILGTDVGSKKLEEEASKFIVDQFDQIKVRANFEMLKQNSKAVDAVFSRMSDNLKAYKIFCLVVEKLKA